MSEKGAGLGTSTRELTEAAVTQEQVTRPGRAVIRALARREARAIVLHPAFLVSVALGLLFMPIVTGATPSDPNWALIFGGMLLWVTIGTALAANACGLRAHRGRVGELYASMPSPAEARTTGLLLGVLVGPGAFAAAVAIVAYPLLRTDATITDRIDVALLVQAPLTIVEFGAFGVALARWIRHPIAAPVAMVVIVANFWYIPWIAVSGVDVNVGWHLAFLGVAIVFWGALALARDRRRSPAFAVSALALIVMIGAAVLRMPRRG